MVGIALVIQACWQQEEDRLAHLGRAGAGPPMAARANTQ
jgi:hypothetical protein